LVLGVALFKARRPRLAALGGAVIGLGGVALSFSAPSDLTGQFMAGAFATVLAAASYSLGGLILQRQRIPDMVAFGAAQLVPATVTLALIACFAEGAPPSHLPHISAIALLALGLVGTCVPVLSLFYLVDRKGAQTAALTTFFIPFAAVAIGVGVLGEALPSTMLYGLCAVVIGSVLIFRNRPR
jgi:drug/metabolite transporter (DMT)-like permease